MIIPPNELALLLIAGGVEGRRVLEFGNKKNPRGLYRDSYLEMRAASYTSVDWNGEDVAVVLDVREPLGEFFPEPFDLVTNFGFSEHVEGDQAAFFRNVHELTRRGGVMVHLVPRVGHWRGHEGMRFAYADRFLAELALQNSYRVDEFRIDPTQSRSSPEGSGSPRIDRDLIGAVLVKELELPFRWEMTEAEVIPC